jgi:hypothetical protein
MDIYIEIEIYLHILNFMMKEMLKCKYGIKMESFIEKAINLQE